MTYKVNRNPRTTAACAKGEAVEQSGCSGLLFVKVSPLFGLLGHYLRRHKYCPIAILLSDQVTGQAGRQVPPRLQKYIVYIDGM
jgi:hypothetical protein